MRKGAKTICGIFGSYIDLCEVGVLQGLLSVTPLWGNRPLILRW